MSRACWKEEKVSNPQTDAIRKSLMSYFDDSEKDKARAEQVWDKVLQEMLLLYRSQHRAGNDLDQKDQTVLALRAYVEDLMDFDWDILKEGWREARRAHKTGFWPTINAIRGACLTVKPKGHSHRPMDEHERRIDTFHKSGFWSSEWGFPPVESEEKKAARHRTWVNSLSPAARDRYDDVQRRLGAGESAVSILQSTEGFSDMPLLPGERLSWGESYLRRKDSLRRAEEEWPG